MLFFFVASLNWEKEQTSNTSVDRRVGHSVCYDDKSNMLYVYGGSKHKRWYNDVYTLNIDTWDWSRIEVNSKQKQNYVNILIMKT